ncbi:MAG: hypothetical protein H7177_01670 [Rhizobacter sp.]|nr:hypothetical protein [Bacteriovorax sp.]
MKKYIFLILVLLINKSFAATGEYVLTASKSVTLEKVQSEFKKTEPESITDMGNNQFLIKYKKDPGFEKLKIFVEPPYKITTKHR